MAVVQRTTSVLESIPRQSPAARRQSRPEQAPSRRHVRVREPQLGHLLRRAALAAIPAACVLTAVYGRMQLLEASVKRSHINASMKQELNKQQVLHSELLNSAQPEQIDRFAQEHGLVMQVTSPIYVSSHRKGR